MIIRFLTISISFFLTSEFIYAQDFKIEMGPDDQGKPVPSARIVSDKFKDGVWTAYEGFELKKSPIINSEPSGYKALQYRENFDVTYVYQGEDQIYYLLSKGRGGNFKNILAFTKGNKPPIIFIKKPSLLILWIKSQNKEKLNPSP